MELDHVIAVVIGLAFTFFLLAAVASGLVEALSQMFLWRGTYLRKSIESMTGVSAAPEFVWAGPGDWLTAHLTRAPARTIRPADAVLAGIGKRLAASKLVGGTIAPLPARIPPDDFAIALIASLPDPEAPIGTRVASLPDGILKTALAAIMAVSGDDPIAFQAGIERWYDSAMRQTTAIYKRFSQIVTLVVATVMTLAANIDARLLARTLWGGPLPFGWSFIPDLGHLPGWLLTILAVWLGAPFWFDLLQNVASLRRSSAPPPA